MAAAPDLEAQRAKIVVGLHPASDGTDEREVIDALGASQRVDLDAKHAWTTHDLLLAADVVVAWNSTVASQAALLEGTLRKHVCFVDAADEPDLPLVVPAQLATQARTSEAAAHFLKKALASQPAPRSSVALPQNAVRAMADRLTGVARRRPKVSVGDD
jgi:hypothetical protein